MRLYENRHPGESWLMWKLGNLLTIPQEWIKSIGIAWGFQEQGKWNFVPRITGNDGLYFNALFFLRLSLPFDIRLGIRWSDSMTKRALFQCGIGFKLNGRFAITFRFQSDVSAAAGTNSPNYGHAQGFEYGTH
jgi:hypothetical protein